MSTDNATRVWKYVGPHDAVEVDGIGLIHNGVPFATDVDLEDHIDFEALDGEAGPGETDPAAELKKLTVPKLREIAAEAGIDHAGLRKDQLIAALTAPIETDVDETDVDQTDDPIVKES